MKITVNEDLSLVPFDRSHKDALANYLNDLDIYNNTLKIPYPYTTQNAEDWISSVLELENIQGMTTNWAVWKKGDDLIGGLGLHQLHGPEAHKDEIGYWLAKPYWNQGIMTEVIKSFCKYCFEQRELTRIEAGVFSHNEASMRVLEKAGFEREGYLKKCFIKKGRYIDSVLYAKVL
jgi:RimJ/RimL family protein N-acetyltransferase